MSLDLEMNQPSGRIIQVGATIHNARNGHLIDSISIYVDPGEPIATDITELTGITDDHVKGAAKVREAYLQLKAWNESHKTFGTPVVWGSGARNDSSTLHEQAAVDEQNFMGYRVIDAKTIFQSFQLFTNKKVRAGLGAATADMGLEWNSTFGKPHDALADAHNTALIWFYMMAEYAGAKAKLDKIRSLVKT